MKPTKKRVLLVDDDPDLVWGIGRCLTRADYSVATCGDGKEAIDLMQTTDFDVLITDIQMPKINGLALIDWIHQHQPSLRIVVMTAFGSPQLRNLTLRKGAILYLEKPVDPALLIEVLNSPTSDSTFAGSIDSIDLFDYIQLMLMTRRQAVVEVSNQCGEKGWLYIDRGDIRHAQCNDLQGEEALFHCLAFESGNFSTLPWHEPDSFSINQRGEYLLMEAAKRKDEAERDNPKPTQPFLEIDMQPDADPHAIHPLELDQNSKQEEK